MPLHPTDTMRYLAPSKPRYWEGTPVQGHTFTAEQQATMKKLRAKMDGNQRRYQLPRVYDVRLKTEPTHEHPAGRDVVFPCPVISGTKDRTRLAVIAPNGMETWVAWSGKQ